MQLTLEAYDEFVNISNRLNTSMHYHASPGVLPAMIKVLLKLALNLQWQFSTVEQGKYGNHHHSSEYGF
jgi:hypothetical protein